MIYQTAWHHIPEDSNLRPLLHLHFNLPLLFSLLFLFLLSLLSMSLHLFILLLPHHLLFSFSNAFSYVFILLSLLPCSGLLVPVFGIMGCVAVTLKSRSWGVISSYLDQDTTYLD
jgi:hypothetical protein